MTPTKYYLLTFTKIYFCKYKVENIKIKMDHLNPYL